MNEDFENDAVWDLLGKAKPVSVSPYFSRRVLRDIRQKPVRASWFSGWMFRWASAGAMALVVAGFFLSVGADRPRRGLAMSTKDFNEAFDAAAGLDNLVAVEDVAVLAYAKGL